MRVYKFLSKHFALKSIRERRLKVSPLLELNDPFDMLPYDLSDPVARVAVRSTLDTLCLEVGIICFSATRNNPVLWTHYADQHRGLCLGFDVPDRFTKRITYIRERMPLPDVLSLPKDEKLAAVDALLYTKFDGWQYEDEVRTSVRLDTFSDGMYFLDWGENLKLAEVVVGFRSATCRRELDCLLAGHGEDVAIVRAQAAHDRFAIVADPDPPRNHDDLTYYRLNGRTMHPVEFVRDVSPLA